MGAGQHHGIGAPRFVAAVDRALVAAACWAAYILIAQAASRVFTGGRGLAIAMAFAVAALASYEMCREATFKARAEWFHDQLMSRASRVRASEACVSDGRLECKESFISVPQVFVVIVVRYPGF